MGLLTIQKIDFPRVSCDLSLLFFVSAYILDLHISCVTATSWYGYLQTVKYIPCLYLAIPYTGWVGIIPYGRKNHKMK